jgi:hypothetical protein
VNHRGGTPISIRLIVKHGGPNVADWKEVKEGGDAMMRYTEACAVAFET